MMALAMSSPQLFVKRKLPCGQPRDEYIGGGRPAPLFLPAISVMSFRHNTSATGRDRKAEVGSGASGRVPAAKADRPLSAQSRDLRGDAVQRAERAGTGHSTRSAAYVEFCHIRTFPRRPMLWSARLITVAVGLVGAGGLIPIQ